MKILLISILFVTTFKSSYALDQTSIEQLIKQGYSVRMGELTGAGSKLSLARLAGFIHPSGIVMKEDCKNIAIAKTSNPSDPRISDVTKVTVHEGTIPASEFEGFFTFQ